MVISTLTPQKTQWVKCNKLRDVWEQMEVSSRGLSIPSHYPDHTPKRQEKNRSLSPCHGWNCAGLGDPEKLCYPLHALALVYLQRASASIPRYAVSEVMRGFPQVLDRETGIEVLRRLLQTTFRRACHE